MNDPLDLVTRADDLCDEARSIPAWECLCDYTRHAPE